MSTTPTVDSMSQKEFQVKYGTLLNSLSATVTSLADKDNVGSITDDQWEHIRSVYEQLLEVQQSVIGFKPAFSHAIKVSVVGNEVQGFVDCKLVYGIYTDMGNPCVSTSQSPCGTLASSEAIVECMRRVLRRAKSIISMKA